MSADRSADFSIGASTAGFKALSDASEPYQPFGRAFCQFTRTAPEEIDWKDEAIRLVGQWMRTLQDLQVSSSGLGLLTAYVRLDAIRGTGEALQLISAEVAGRMEKRAKDCFAQRGERLTTSDSPGCIVIEGWMDVDQAGSLRTSDITIH